MKKRDIVSQRLSPICFSVGMELYCELLTVRQGALLSLKRLYAVPNTDSSNHGLQYN